MIQARLSNVSSDEGKFTSAKFSYEEALKKCGFSNSLSFSPPSDSPTQKRKRSRNIIWFNPPFSMHVSTNIGKNFLKLVCKHFPPAHRYHKTFNKNNLKISYSCMSNMKAVINQQNKKLLSINSSPIRNSTSSQPKSLTRNNNPAEKSCNCRQKETCPLNGKCLQKRVVYQATVRTNLLSKSFIGSCETTFKTRYNNHKQSFKNVTHRHVTALSQFIWKLKESNTDFNITWKIVASVSENFCKGRTCSLCLTEKAVIIKEDPTNILNARGEILNKRRHRNKFKLRRIH